MIPTVSAWNQLVTDLRTGHPTERITRLRNWAGLVLGLLRARSACLPHIAAQLPWPILAESRTKRLSRFLDNAAVAVSPFWAPLACLVVRALVAAGAPLRLLLDRTEVEGRFNLLLVVLAFGRRAFPLLWVELGHEGTCNFREQRRLLKQVQAWIPVGARVIVIGDREFRSTQLARWPRLELCPATQVRHAGGGFAGPVAALGRTGTAVRSAALAGRRTARA